MLKIIHHLQQKILFYFYMSSLNCCLNILAIPARILSQFCALTVAVCFSVFCSSTKNSLGDLNLEREYALFYQYTSEEIFY